MEFADAVVGILMVAFSIFVAVSLVAATGFIVRRIVFRSTPDADEYRPLQRRRVAGR